MGLCSRVPTLRPARRRTAILDTPLQLAPAAWQYRIKAACQPTPHDREQPVESPQLGMSGYLQIVGSLKVVLRFGRGDLAVGQARCTDALTPIVAAGIRASHSSG